jgi:hypothetical protein
MEKYTETFKVKYQKSNVPKNHPSYYPHNWEDITQEEYLMYKMDGEVTVRKLILVPTEREIEIERNNNQEFQGYSTGIAYATGVATSFPQVSVSTSYIISYNTDDQYSVKT